MAEESLQEGVADLISLGRSQIADPDFAIKAFTGKADEIRPCLSCLQCLYSLDEMHCIHCAPINIHKDS